jgi:hypothetical protein
MAPHGARGRSGESRRMAPFSRAQQPLLLARCWLADWLAVPFFFLI